jgi:hypothetical protein
VVEIEERARSWIIRKFTRRCIAKFESTEEINVINTSGLIVASALERKARK